MPIYKPMRGTGWRRGYLSNTFSPISISGLQLWLLASRGVWQDSALTTPATADGDPVGGWVDQSSNSSNATQGTTSLKPTLKLNIKNGQPVVRFDGVDDFLTFGNLAALNVGTGNFSIFAVASSNGLTNRGLFAKDSIAGVSNGLFVYTGAGNKASWWNGSIDVFVTSSTWNSWKILGVQRAGTGANLLTTYENGALLNTNTDSRTLSNSLSAFLGAVSPGTSNLSCDIGEVLFFNTALSVGDRANLVNYLNGKWGVF